MTYFNTISSYEDLKKQYRTLATANHPDIGGNVETMKAINNEYDIFFPIWKTRNKVKTNETAYSTRSEFYTQNGWKGENYDSSQSLKDIAIKIRAYVKELYPTCKFSITTEYASMCQELHVKLMEAPYAVYKAFEDWTEEDHNNFRCRSFYDEKTSEKSKETFTYTDTAKAMIEDVDAQVNSYNHDDSDGMIDYFDVKFYYMGCKIGKWDKPFKIVEKQARLPKTDTTAETGGRALTDTNDKQQPYTYEIWQDIDTRDGSTIFMVKILEKLDKGEYITASKYMKKLGGYYSKFKRGFLFKADPTEVLTGTKSAEETPKAQPAAPVEPTKQNSTIIQEKIQKQIGSNNLKIEKLSGNYQTNTYKRMREQDSRDSKIRGYQLDNDILNYLLDRLDEEQPLTKLENALLSGTFRTDIQSKCDAHKRFVSGKAGYDIKYPAINPEWEKDNWYNIDVPKQQKRLNNAGITNTKTLIEAVGQYAKILDVACKPIDQTVQKIKKLERECKMMQKGDINFTPTEVARQLVNLAMIDSNSKVLEPSAGTGAIADCIREVTQNVDVVECMSTFRELLQLKSYNLVGDDFLEYHPIEKYQAIIMNPPFSDEQNHIKHAYSMLADGGTLVSISSPHWTFAGDKKSVEFRNWLDNETYYTKDLASGTFEMTGVSAKILVIEKN